MSLMNQLYQIQDINNGALKSIKAMPQKDSTSDGTSTFSMARAIYSRKFPVQSQISTAQKNQKKWLGNRDASHVTANRRNTNVGKGSINTTNQNLLSFTTYKDVNVVNDAIRRTRAGGYVAPPKTNFTKNGVTPYFRPAVPKYENYIGVKYPVLYH